LNGAGKIGSTIAGLLAGAYDVLVIDQSEEALAALDARPRPATSPRALSSFAESWASTPHPR
jgi:3-hydroxyacyl-CoA dehydrogenase